MPRLVVPKFLAAAAVVSEKIDAVVRELCAVVNGGLDSANIDPATRFPLVAFLNPSSLFGVAASVVASGAENAELSILRAPVAGRVVAWSLRVADGSALVNARLLVNGVEVDASGGLSAGAEVMRPLSPPVAAGVGHVVKVTTTSGIGVTFTATVFVLTDHVA